MNYRKIAALLYPLVVGGLIPLMLYLAMEQDAGAGTIRHAELSPDHPLVVRLAIGRSTALSFMTKPEKVVPGSPDAIEINFLGRDLTLRPLGRKPGNLILYTKSNRYVILLQLVSESIYDDAVVVNTFSSYSRPIKLTDDTFTVQEIKMKDSITKSESTFTTLIKRSGTVLESDCMPDGLKCNNCVSKKQANTNTIVCAHAIETLQCRLGKRSVTIERQKNGG